MARGPTSGRSTGTATGPGMNSPRGQSAWESASPGTRYSVRGGSALRSTSATRDSPRAAVGNAGSTSPAPPAPDDQHDAMPRKPPDLLAQPGGKARPREQASAELDHDELTDRHEPLPTPRPSQARRAPGHTRPCSPCPPTGPRASRPHRLAPG